MKRKLLFTLIALLAAIIPAQASTLINGLYYNLDATTQTAEVTYKYSSSSNSSYVSGELTIPETVTFNGTTYSVTSIGNNAFGNCRSLTSVTIPNSVTSVGSSVFSGCSNLTSVTIPNSVTSIGNSAFYNCSGLTNVTIPNSVTSIGESVFSGCSSLTSVTIPDGVTSISNYAFYNCRSLVNVTIGNSVTTIGRSAFQNCNSLTSIAIPNSVTNMGSGAFSGCSSLTTVHISDIISWCTIEIDGNTYITSPLYYAENLYLNGELITNLIIPDGVTTIKDHVFEDYTKLTSVTIPSSVTTIGVNAFSKTSLTEMYVRATVPPTGSGNPSTKVIIYIPQGTTDAYKAAWGNFTYKELTNDGFLTGDFDEGQIIWIFNPTTGELTIEGTGDLPDFSQGMKDCPWIEYSQEITSVEIAYGITAIGNYAFSQLPNVTELNIPASVKRIGYNIFENSGITTIYYNSPTATVDYNFFSGVIDSSMGGWIVKDSKEYAMLTNSKVTEIVFGEGVEEIPPYFFANDTLLSSVTLPNTIRRVGKNAFYRCRNLHSVTLPEGLTVIDSCLFQQSGIESIVIPESVTRICQYAFCECEQLKSISLPNSVTILERGAFAGVDLDYFCISDGVKTIPTYLFTSYMNYSYLYSSIGCLIVGKGVELIEQNAFSNCQIDTVIWNAPNPEVYDAELKRSCFASSSSSLVSVVLGEEVTSICNYAFNNCRYLTSVTVPKGLISIGDYAFNYCSALTGISLGDNVTYIGSYAFYGCTELRSVNIPEKVEHINKYAFYKCSSLTDITFPEGLSYIDSYAFYQCTSLRGSLIIPDNVGVVETSAFYGCTSLESIKIGSGVYYMGDYAFGSCAAVESVTFTGGYIGVGAFASCKNLRSLTIDTGNNNVTIANSAFHSCVSLNKVVLPTSIYSVGQAAFYNCTNLQSVSVGENVNTIGPSAFSGCTSLVELSFWGRCSLEDKAFADCPALMHIYNYNDIPNTCASSVFDGLDKFSCKLHIPLGSIDKYRIASVWRDFYYMEEMGDLFTLTVLSAVPEQGSVTGGGTYPSGAEVRIEAIPTDGFRFTHWNDGITDNPRTIILTEDVSYTAFFEQIPIRYWIFAWPNSESMGTVIGEGEYDAGSVASLTAIPFDGYRFVKWLEDDNTDNPRNVIVTDHAIYTAYFESAPTYTIGAMPYNHTMGEVVGGGEYTEGMKIAIEAIAYDGYRFAYWLDNYDNYYYDNPHNIIVTDNATYTAYFVPATPSVLEDTTEEFSTYARKVIENGTIYILLPDGRKLNLQGAEVK